MEAQRRLEHDQQLTDGLLVHRAPVTPPMGLAAHVLGAPLLERERNEHVLAFLEREHF